MSCDHHHHEGPVFNKVVKAKQKVASVLLKTAKTLELSFDQRQDMPHEAVTTDGTPIVCHIEDPVEVGDKLISAENQWLVITAAVEELFEVARQQERFDEFLHVAGLSMWPVQLTDHSALLVASHDCMHMLEHFGLEFNQLTGPIHEIAVPELEHNDCCDHDHAEGGHHHHHGHSHDHNHEH